MGHCGAGRSCYTEMKLEFGKDYTDWNGELETVAAWEGSSCYSNGSNCIAVQGWGHVRRQDSGAAD